MSCERPPLRHREATVDCDHVESTADGRFIPQAEDPGKETMLNPRDDLQSVVRNWSARPAVWSGVLSLVLLVAGFGGWAAFASISGAVIASGHVEVEQNRQVVQHPDGGVIEAILVNEGEHVPAGTVLMRLDGVLLRSELSIVESQFYETLARRGRLEAERDETPAPMFPAELVAAAAVDPEVDALLQGQISFFEARGETLAQMMEQLDRQLIQIGNRIQGIAAQIAALEEELVYLTEERSGQEHLLAQGLTQAARVLNLKRDDARLRGRLGELATEQAQTEAAISEVEMQKLQLRTERREAAQAELREVAITELELIERRRSLQERIARLEIRAPVAGVVHDLQITTPRAVLRPAEPALFLVPQDRPLIIAARVDPADIDKIQVGQEARLLFPAFNARTTPELDGWVSLVPADALTNQQTQARHYRVEITLSEGELERLEEQRLLPGMSVEIFFAAGTQTPIAYLTKPFMDYFRKAFRES